MPTTTEKLISGIMVKKFRFDRTASSHVFYQYYRNVWCTSAIFMLLIFEHVGRLYKCLTNGTLAIHVAMLFHRWSHILLSLSQWRIQSYTWGNLRWHGRGVPKLRTGVKESKLKILSKYRIFDDIFRSGRDVRKLSRNSTA